MLDISYIRNNSLALKQNITNRNLSGDMYDVDAFLAVDKKRSELIAHIDSLRAKRNEKSCITSRPSESDVLEGKRLKEEIKNAEATLSEIQSTWQQHMDWFPNVVSEHMPVGKDESGNQEIKIWGEKKKFNFDAQSHIDIGERLDIIDVSKSGDISGSRFYFLKKDAALLHWGLMSFVIKKLTQKGFELMIPPVIVKSRPLYGTGYFPAEQSQIYELTQGEALEDEQRRYLVGTSEQAIVSYHMDEILAIEKFPIKYAGVSTCFRSEAGSWGKDVKGIKRVHQFDKVEMIYITTPQTSQAFMAEALAIEEEILQELGLTYHVLEMCTGDVGLPTFRKWDVEVWLPSQQTWMETHSNSDLASYHTRRLNIRYKNEQGETVYPHTVSATAITNTRPIAAILDTYQQEDGSVLVPEVLREWVGKDVISSSNQ
ncbi:serine--tRNA ligase [candidate division WWE3 bacterium CG_4_10_14_0_2_um_filter_41_14]|uniref:Serine--tRNA ligase n=1 Tax=candidate division WWE3 bacterium CG_4_10_14_0_2_um_filter_41_14 TaxID=1975072 RepID=A0A2M7TK32_UNCKA|nr:MAG: serine--tRNA ligase [candidate division WWE3 bacterium CG_4_10_14_0_2_um_filter_41_14]